MTKFEWLEYLYNLPEQKAYGEKLEKVLNMDCLEIQVELENLEMVNLIEVTQSDWFDNEEAGDLIFYLTPLGKNEYLETKRTRDIQDKSAKRSSYALLVSSFSIIISLASLGFMIYSYINE